MFAIIDLGSNSFHMLITKWCDGEFQVVDRIKQKVRLAAGLDENNRLSQESIDRGLACIKEFAAGIEKYQLTHIKAVATATLRLAKNSNEFLVQAEAILGLPINLISGEQEADYIYQGASSSFPKDTRSLIIDIGGASTEIIVGKGNKAFYRVSLNMGCVTYLHQHLKHSTDNASSFQNAVNAAKQALVPHKNEFLRYGWDQCLGASGTPQALTEIKQFNRETSPIDLPFLQQLAQMSKSAADITNLSIPGLEERRKEVFASGLAILLAIFEELQITRISLSPGALREGVLHQLKSEAH